jgi:hypothetical protein
MRAKENIEFSHRLVDAVTERSFVKLLSFLASKQPTASKGSQSFIILSVEIKDILRHVTQIPNRISAIVA